MCLILDYLELKNSYERSGFFAERIDAIVDGLISFDSNILNAPLKYIPELF